MEERNGHISWGLWAFDYAVSGREGLSLLSGFFKGRKIFGKLSLPVIRVKYVRDEDFWHNPVLGNGCGPYNDQITWDPEDFGENLNPFSGPHHLVKIKDCGERYICIRSTAFGGTTWLELGVYARIGAYHIYQSWYLNNDGVILPRVFSKGLSCNLDHWHHPYWRLDFDLDGESGQRVNVFNGSTFVGFVNHEGRFLNSSIGDARYNVENLRTGLKAWIIPPTLNSEAGVVGPTEFSNLDAYVRKFRSEEDRHWTHAPEHEIGFPVHENPDGGDIVFWSICHLSHHAHEGKDHWHEVGPSIVVDIPQGAPIRPEDCRQVNFRGNIHIKDYKLVGKDKWGHHEFNETLIVDPNAPHAEVHIRRGPTGDVTADLIFRIDWRSDRSVAVNFTAELYDEAQRVVNTGSSFNVLRDSSTGWGGLHLVDYHGGDPDTADMDFTVTNNQCPGHPQADWRYCHKCHAMFFDGYPNKGVCPAGGGHAAAGYNFVLPHDVAASGQSQADWRFCHKCHVLFFDGYREKGVCPARGGHEAMGFNFVLPHDIPALPQAQDAWRYCHKCHEMFFDGYPNKGVCPAGGGHAAAGYNFVLSHT